METRPSEKPHSSTVPLRINPAISQSFGKVQYSEHTEEMSIKSVSFSEEETVYRFNYWEIPSRVRNSEYTFRYSLGCTAAIYMFDGTCSVK